MASFRAVPLLALIFVTSIGATVQPGGWTHTLTIDKATIPGIPGFLIPKGKQRPYRSCLSPADAARNPGALLVGEKMTCVPEKILMADGEIRSVATCIDQRLGTKMTVKSVGTYSATSYALRSVSTGTRKGKPLRVETASSGRRTHSC